MPPLTLEIKVNAIKRLTKERGIYAQEVKDQQAQVQALKDQDADVYEIKKQEEVLEEGQRMIPELEDKIATHKQALKEYLETYLGDEDVTEAKELVA